jgi:hypothetical protein
MWTCPTCKRVFNKENQPHSCKIKPLSDHFKNKEKAKELFEYLFEYINTNVGKSKVISIPCCIHLFGKYDFMAVLPKKDKIEIRFALNKKIDNRLVKEQIPVSSKLFKICLEIYSKDDLDENIIDYFKTSYYLKD